MNKLSAVAAALLSALVVPGLAAQSADSPSTPSADSPSTSVSKVRIVRLSDVRGAVEIDRAAGRGYEPAIANLPVVEQSKLQTKMGAAEVEFEDNSTLRVGTDTDIEFPQLGRTASGSTVSSVRLVKGTLYVSLMKARQDQFTLQFADHTITLPPASHIRVEMDQKRATLAVLDGSLQIDGPSGPLQLAKKKSVTFDLKNGSQPLQIAKLDAQPLDEWDKEAARNHQRIATFGAFNSPYAYGMNDLAYYGSFSNPSGCGLMWRPYFASAAWDPYSNGAWAWYGGSGYSWVSPYPWGWTPYHYGSWSYCDGTGWGWMPGGSWNGLNNVGMTATRLMTTVPGSKGLRPIGGPVKPVHPPAAGGPSLIAVNSRPLVRSEITSPESFQFRRDSAGMGVPRSGLGNLNKFSQHAIARGVVSTPVYVQVPARSSFAARPGMLAGSAVGVPMIHRGYAASSGMPSAPSGSPSASMSGGRGYSGPSSSMSAPAASAASSMGHASAPSGGGGSASAHH